MPFARSPSLLLPQGILHVSFVPKKLMYNSCGCRSRQMPVGSLFSHSRRHCCHCQTPHPPGSCVLLRGCKLLLLLPHVIHLQLLPSAHPHAVVCVVGVCSAQEVELGIVGLADHDAALKLHAWQAAAAEAAAKAAAAAAAGQ
jgi:hypothetical protein